MYVCMYVAPGPPEYYPPPEKIEKKKKAQSFKIILALLYHTPLLIKPTYDTAAAVQHLV